MIRTLPKVHAGAEALCCRGEAGERKPLTMAPRHALHNALANPHIYLGGPKDMTLSPALEDACLAYRLFLEVMF